MEAVWSRVVEIESYIYLYIRDLLFPWCGGIINSATDIIWERGKELKLCSKRPLEWAGDSYPEIKIQEEKDLCLCT